MCWTRERFGSPFEPISPDGPICKPAFSKAGAKPRHPIYHSRPRALWLPLIHHDMPSTDLDHDELIKALTDNFNILADEVQLLSDRKTILEHKLRFAHEQVSKERHSFCFTVFSYIMMKNFSSRSGAATAATTDKHHVS